MGFKDLYNLGALKIKIQDEFTKFQTALTRHVNGTVNRHTADHIDFNGTTVHGMLESLQNASPYITQANWYVDSVSGNDANDGSVGSPLQTLLELGRRLSNRRVIPTAVTVNLLGSFPTQDLILTGIDLPDQGAFNINGQVTEQASGSTTSFTQINASTSTPASFNSASISDFTPYLGMRIRWTSGAGLGATAWILKATATNVARISIPLTIDGVRKTPAAGNTFVIEDMTCTVRTAILDIRGGGNKGTFVPAVYVTNLDLKNSNNQDHQFTGQGRAAYGLWVSWCRLNGTVTSQFVSGEVGWQGNLSWKGDTFFQGKHVFYGHTGLDAGTVFFGPVNAFFGEDSFNQNGDFAVNGPAYIYSSANIGIVDYSDTSCVQLNSGVTLAFVTGGKVAWGTNNTGGSNYGVNCSDNAAYLYATKPTITSGGGDAKIGSLVKTWAQVPFYDGYDGVTLGTGGGAMIKTRSS